MDEKNPYTVAAMMSILVGNDFHYMHILADGVDFDKSHNLAEQYYDKIADESDYLLELALEFDAPVLNPTNALTYIPSYIPESLGAYDYLTLIEHLSEKVAVYIGALKALHQFTPDNSVQSWIDDTVRDWEKELNYRLARRGNTEVGIAHRFINTGADEMIVGLVQDRPEMA